MKEPLPLYGNKEKSTAPLSFSRPGETTPGESPHSLISCFMDNLVFSEMKAGNKHKGTKSNNAKPYNPRTEMNGKKLIEVQPSPSPEN